MACSMRNCLAGLALLSFASASPANADSAFIKFLNGPWGQSDASGEPMAGMMMKPGAPQFHRKSCPPAGVAMKDMVPNEIWFATLENNQFVRVSMSHGGKLVPFEYNFQRLDDRDTAVFTFANPLGLTGTMRITRLSPTRLRLNSEFGPTKREEFYVRCKGLSG